MTTVAVLAEDGLDILDEAEFRRLLLFACWILCSWLVGIKP